MKQKITVKKIKKYSLCIFRGVFSRLYQGVSSPFNPLVVTPLCIFETLLIVIVNTGIDVDEILDVVEEYSC